MRNSQGRECLVRVCALNERALKNIEFIKIKLRYSSLMYLSRTKNQPKEEVFGTDIPRTTRGHSRGYPGPKLRSGQSKSWKNKHFGADIHDPKARTSTTLRGFQKLRSEKLWAEFSLPNLAQAPIQPKSAISAMPGFLLP